MGERGRRDQNMDVMGNHYLCTKGSEVGMGLRGILSAAWASEHDSNTLQFVACIDQLP